MALHIAVVDPAASNGGPQLLFSDLVSGPAIGNSDTTHGAGGAIVTVWGRGLGSAQGASTITIGGVTAPVYEWKNAAGPAADMYSRHGMQMISFLLPSTVAAGTQRIQANIAGVLTNTLPFSVRAAGNIYYVKTTGADTNNGSWSAPWRTLPKAIDSMASGDIIYVGDGVTATTTHDIGAHGCINLNRDGTADLPRALVAYPGATVNVGGVGATCTAAFSNYIRRGNVDGRTEYWVVSKLRALGVGGDQSALQAYTGYRLVANYVSMPRPDDNCQSGAMTGEGNDLAILGNQITNTARDNPTTVSKLCHSMYISGKRSSSQFGDTCGGIRCPTESNREIGWNLLNDNYNNRGINLYSEQDRAAFIENHKVHDNYIINHRGNGMLIGYYVTGENWFYNNVLINTGLGPEWAGGEISGHYAIQINGGHESGRPTTLHIWNNTIYGGGYPANTSSAALTWFKWADLSGISVNLDFRNNVIVSPNVPYMNADASLPAVAAPNLWFGQSAVPAWNPAGIAGDPLFANPAAGNVRLLVGSPAIDRGIATPLTSDFDGIFRPQGAAFDLGAFEYR
ncbi:MAG: hypothetical protein HY308_15630 [Gammaproteobacteria bacterium]|nr:hypothetical protein [Gammaproteobacteria bacterium]